MPKTIVPDFDAKGNPVAAFMAGIEAARKRQRGIVTLTPRSRVSEEMEKRKRALEHRNATAGSVRINGSGQAEGLLTDQEKLDVAKSKERWQSREAVLANPPDAAPPLHGSQDAKKSAKKTQKKHHK
eukprot:2390857-Heterocapsa_arctica.AAC.1